MGRDGITIYIAMRNAARWGAVGVPASTLRAEDSMRMDDLDDSHDPEHELSSERRDRTDYRTPSLLRLK